LIGKKCLIKSSNNIEICDHAILQQRIILRGDLAKVSIGKPYPSIGKYVVLSEMVIIKPPTKRQNKELKYVPITIGIDELTEATTYMWRRGR
jgi:hypothetical protein